MVTGRNQWSTDTIFWFRRHSGRVDPSTSLLEYLVTFFIFFSNLGLPFGSANVVYFLDYSWMHLMLYNFDRCSAEIEGRLVWMDREKPGSCQRSELDHVRIVPPKGTYGTTSAPNRWCWIVLCFPAAVQSHCLPISGSCVCPWDAILLQSRSRDELHSVKGCFVQRNRASIDFGTTLHCTYNLHFGATNVKGIVFQLVVGVQKNRKLCLWGNRGRT